MFTYAQRLMEERDHLTGMAQTAAEKAAAEDRDLTDTERSSLASWQERCAAIDAQLEEHRVQIDSQRHWAELRSKLADTDTDPAANGNANGNGNGTGRRAAKAEVVPAGWGAAFVESDQFRNYVGSGSSGRVEMPSGLLETRAAADPITTATLGDFISPHQFTPPTPRWASTVLNAIGRERVSSGSIEYFYFKPNPGPVAQPVAEGALKPPADITMEEKAAALQTWAHWKAITRQALEDAPRIRSIVEEKLRAGLLLALENAAMSTLVANADIGAAAVTGPDLLTAIRLAVAQVQINGYTPTAVLLNPGDWAAMDVSIMGSTLGGPAVGGTFWGLRPVATASVPAGTAYVGDLATGITLFDRNLTSVFVSDSHADFFIKNQLLILAETRALPAVVEPAAVVKATSAAGGSETFTATIPPVEVNQPRTVPLGVTTAAEPAPAPAPTPPPAAAKGEGGK